MRMIFNGYVIDGSPREMYELTQIINDPFTHGPIDLVFDKDKDVKVDNRLLSNKYCDDIYLVSDEITGY